MSDCDCEAMSDLPIRIEYEMPHERWDVFRQHPQTVRKAIEVIFVQDNDMVGRVDFELDDRAWDPEVKMTVSSRFWGLLNTHSVLLARLAGRWSLAEVKQLLDESGAHDRTDRVDQTISAPARRALAEWHRNESPANARAAAEALITLAGNVEEPPF